MSAMESMVRTILASMDLDVEAMKTDIAARIKNFEGNVETLNTTLINIFKRIDKIEAMLVILFEHHGLELPKETANGQQRAILNVPGSAKETGSAGNKDSNA